MAGPWALLIGGPPCVGKSRALPAIVAAIGLEGPWTTCDPDLIVGVPHSDASRLAVQQFHGAVSKGQNVVYVGTCASGTLVGTLVRSARAGGARAIVAQVYAPFKLVLERWAWRQAVQPVPETTVRELYGYFQRQARKIASMPVLDAVYLFEYIDQLRLLAVRRAREPLELMDCEAVQYYFDLLDRPAVPAVTLAP